MDHGIVHIERDLKSKLDLGKSKAIMLNQSGTRYDLPLEKLDGYYITPGEHMIRFIQWVKTTVRRLEEQLKR